MSASAFSVSFLFQAWDAILSMSNMSANPETACLGARRTFLQGLGFHICDYSGHPHPFPPVTSWGFPNM